MMPFDQVTGRITFALARDGAFPASRSLARVTDKLQSPVNAITMVFVLDALLLLMPLYGDNAATAFNSIIGEHTTCGARLLL